MPKLADREFLTAFEQMGCFLVDLSLEPIDKLPDRENRHARQAPVPGLARRVKGMTPRVVVVVVKGIVPQVNDALARTGFGDAPTEALPFPGQWHRDDCAEGLTELVKAWRRRRLLRSAQ